jgi:hypothetical protein
MPVFIMLTRLGTEAVKLPAALEDLERQVVARIEKECPKVKWLASYAVLGPCDYLDVFEAPGIEVATKVSTLIRTFGAMTSRARCSSRSTRSGLPPRCCGGPTSCSRSERRRPAWPRSSRVRPDTAYRTCRTVRPTRGCSGRSGRRAGDARSRSAPRDRTTSATGGNMPSAMSATRTTSTSAMTARTAPVGRGTSPTSSDTRGPCPMRPGKLTCARATSRPGSGTSSATRNWRGARPRPPRTRISSRTGAAGGSSMQYASAM